MKVGRLGKFGGYVGKHVITRVSWRGREKLSNYRRVGSSSFTNQGLSLR